MQEAFSFSRRNSFTTAYFFDSQKLKSVHSLIDLRVLFDQRLCFNLYIKYTMNEARTAVGFIKR